MRIIKIFLASSSELLADREQFEILIGRINQAWKKKEYFLELIIWENFLDIMSVERLQNEYNKEIKDCDIFIMLFFTKVGIYTDEEFETAFGNYKINGKPLVYTYFKNMPIYTADLVENDILSLFKFKAKLKLLGHFFTTYNNIEDLKLKFNDQLNKLIEKGLIRKSQLSIEPSLKKRLEEEKSFCRKNNIYIYAANLLNVVLQSEDSLAFATLNAIKRGYPKLLAIKLQKLINTDFIELKKANDFVEQDWFDRSDFITAADLAEKENAKFIEEKHLLLGIIAQDGSTVKMIRGDLQERGWKLFLDGIKYHNNNDTPITLI